MKRLRTFAGAVLALALSAAPATAAEIEGRWETIHAYEDVVLRVFHNALTKTAHCWVQADFTGELGDGPAHTFRLSIGFDVTEFLFNVEILSDPGWVELRGHIIRLEGGVEFPLIRLLGHTNTVLMPENEDGDEIARGLLAQDYFYLRYVSMNGVFEAVGEIPGLRNVMLQALERCDDARTIRRDFIETGGWSPPPN